MLILHHLENSRSQRLLWLLEKLGLDYKIKIYKRDPKTKLAPKELLDINPLGKSPVIESDGIILSESGAIFEWILCEFDKKNQLHPMTSNSNYKDHLFWMHFAEGSFMPPLVTRLLHNSVLTMAPFFIKPIAKAIFKGIEDAYLGHTIKYSFDFVENKLVNSKYLTGDILQASDILMSFPLEASLPQLHKRDYPNIFKYVESLKSDEHYKAALKKGGEYDY